MPNGRFIGLSRMHSGGWWLVRRFEISIKFRALGMSQDWDWLSQVAS
jgi:hypothetical protein